MAARCWTRDRLEATVAAYLHTLVARSATTAELTVRVRAAQTAAFHLGWQLQVRLERLVSTASTPSAAAARSRSTWQVLRLYRDPLIGTGQPSWTTGSTSSSW